MDAATRDRFLTVTWNNRLSAGLAIPVLAYTAVVLFSSALSNRTAFIGMSVLGGVY